VSRDFVNLLWFGGWLVAVAVLFAVALRLPLDTRHRGALRGLYVWGIAAAAVAVVAGLFAVYPHLKGYQKERIDVIIHPEKADPKGYAYQTIQSVIAVGSGGVIGKGVGQSTQGKLGYLPFAWTDFIAAVIAEEMGFAGILLMMALYLIFIWRMVAVAVGSRDRAGALMIMGFVALIGFHILCNLGMVVGLMPIMGIPLPLMSSGGTAVISMFIGSASRSACACDGS